jgi:hypothetical protein
MCRDLALFLSLTEKLHRPDSSYGRLIPIHFVVLHVDLEE